MSAGCCRWSDREAAALVGTAELDGGASQRPVSIGGVRPLAIRTDVGVDLLCDSAATAELRAALEQAGAVVVSEEAIEALRIERGSTALWDRPR